MKDFFTTTIGAWDDGSVRLTAPGIAVVVIIIALLVVVAAIIRHKDSEKKRTLTTKQLVYSAVAIALAVVCSMIKFANLPIGRFCYFIQYALYRTDRLLVRTLCWSYDCYCLWSGTVCYGTDLLYTSTDDPRLSFSFRCFGNCRIFCK